MEVEREELSNAQVFSRERKRMPVNIFAWVIIICKWGGIYKSQRRRRRALIGGEACDTDLLFLD